MVWCTCPTRCKGGRDVCNRTHSRHERELQDDEARRLLPVRCPDLVDEEFPDYDAKLLLSVRNTDKLLQDGDAALSQRIEMTSLLAAKILHEFSG